MAYKYIAYPKWVTDEKGKAIIVQTFKEHEALKALSEKQVIKRPCKKVKK